MSLHLRNNKIAVEKSKKADKDKNAFLHIPESEEYLGIVRHVGPNASPDIKVGDVVYYSTNCQKVRMAGTEYLVMTDDQVYAVVKE